MITIQLSDFSLSYPGRPLLRGINLGVAAGQWLCLLGRSGCGKSTLLKAIAGIEHGATQSGTVILRSASDTQHFLENSNDLDSTQTNRVIASGHCASIDHPKVAYMAQQDALLPWLSLLENVQFPLRLKRSRSISSAQQAQALLDRVGLADHAHKKPYQLSGGQRQRVALARTLMMDATIVLMDEPFSALDAITRLELQALAVELLQDKTVFLITHDPIEAIRLADEIYVIRNHSLTSAFIPQGSRPRFQPQLAEPQLQTLLLEALL